MIINEKAPLSRAMLGELRRQAPPGIPVLQPEPDDPDVWQVLGGDKDDFLIYDRCGRLAFHIQLPYSFLHFPYVESAIRFTHSKDFCGNCSLYPNTTWEANSTVELPVTPSPLPKQEEESEAPIHRHNPLHPHHHHEVSSERAADVSGDPKPATHVHHHHGDHGQPHHERKEQEEGNEH
ncbi:SELPB protein, partial [Urocolius indicus]|nr:SELPB protein [Urocolius indicus]